MNKSGFMRFSIIAMSLIAAVFAALSFIPLLASLLSVIPGFSWQPEIDFTGWFTVVIFFIFSIIQIFCVFTEKFTVRKIGFYLLHIGLVMFLLGNFMYYVKGDSFYAYIPIDGNTYSHIQRENGEFINLGFGIGAENFTVEKYSDGVTDKWYEADMIISSGNQREKDILAANHTIKKNGWKLYLMNYTVSSPGSEIDSIAVLFKHDPGEYTAVAGIIFIISGSFIACFTKERGKTEVKK